MADENYLSWTHHTLKARDNFFASLKIESIVADLQNLSEPAAKKAKGESKPKPVIEQRESSRRVVELAQKREQEALLASKMKPADCALKSDCSADDMNEIAKDVASSKLVSGQVIPGPARCSIAAVTMVKVSKGGLLTSVAVHPSENKIFAAIGNSAGRISFLAAKIEYDTSSITEIEHRRYQIHAESPVNCLQFDSSCHLLSGGTDGTVRLFDMNAFEKGNQTIYTPQGNEDAEWSIVGVASVPGEPCFTRGDIWAANFDGTVIRLDCRCQHPTGKHRLGLSDLSSIAALQVKSLTYLATAARDGTVGIWDVRCLPITKGAPISSFTYINTARSCIVNPVNPTLLLVSYGDSSLKVLEFNRSKPDIDILWTSPPIPSGKLKAALNVAWHPSDVDKFFTTSETRELTMYSALDDSKLNAFTRTILRHENFGINLTMMRFHPKLPILVCNSSGTRSYILLMK